MAVGCYVIGESKIHLSAQDLPLEFFVNGDYISHFKAACCKLPQKLDCLVIVDAEHHDPPILKEIFEYGKGFANVVYIIPPIVAFLQYAITKIKHFVFDTIMIALKKSFYYASVLVKKHNVFTAIHVKRESIASLHNLSRQYAAESHFFSCKSITHNERALFHIPSIQIHSQLISTGVLAIGGFLKALCIAEPGQHLEVLNFTLGIWDGFNAPVVPRCCKFPLTANFSPSLNEVASTNDVLLIQSKIRKGTRNLQFKIEKNKRICNGVNGFQNCVIEYNEYGLLQIQKKKLPISFSIFNDFTFPLTEIKVFSMRRELIATFNFVNKEMTFTQFTDFAKSTVTYEWLNAVEPNSQGLPYYFGNLHTIFVEDKCQNYINGPIISITPEYVGVLQYYITYFKPTTTYVIVLIATKQKSTFYALIQRSPMCYSISHIGEYSEACRLYDPEMLSSDKKLRILCIHERKHCPTLAFDFSLSTNISVTRFEISNLEEITFIGGALYALQNSLEVLTSPYVTFDPLFHPEHNNCDGLDLISRKPRSQFCKFDAIIHAALSLIKSPLFWGDLIAILLPVYDAVHIYYFCHIKGKFLFKEEQAILSSEIITSSMLHFADRVVVVKNSDTALKTENQLQATCLKWDEKSGRDKFVKDLDGNNLLVCDTQLYSDAVVRAVESKLYSARIFDKSCMLIEYCNDKCRILLDNPGEYLAVNDEEWILMKISLTQSSMFVCQEKATMEDSSIAYDFIKLLGATLNNHPSPDPTWQFQLVAMNGSEDSEIGYKIKAPSSGFLILSPEMAFTIYLKRLIKIYEKYTQKMVNEIILKADDMVFTENQKRVLKNVGNRLKIDLNLLQ